MFVFNGIMNVNGIEKKIKLFFENNIYQTYDIDFYINDCKVDAIIEKDTCIIQNSRYKYGIKIYKDEILIFGKEYANLLHYIIPCIYRPNFFVLTNKEEV